MVRGPALPFILNAEPPYAQEEIMAAVSSSNEPVAEEPLRPEQAWDAVLARDPRFDGRFVYGVASTGVFCRPVCPARRPRRSNVTFFSTPAEAEAAGFRPCRRCRPVDSSPSALARAVERARVYLDQHLDEKVTLERLSRVTHMSPFHLQRTFKRLFGVSPREYVQARRADHLKQALRRGETVTRASFEAGYGSTSRAYEGATARLGMTPATYRRGGEGLQIRFCVVPSPLGRLLVAATERGLCAVSLGEEDGELEEALRREYPRARIERADDQLAEWTEVIVRVLDGSGEPLDLPLDVRSTAFQLRVWRALQEIPPGSTLSYRQLATRIGAPTAARAVARACATNPVALVIPCHRIVREDGQLGGYRWGMERKRRLLETEAGVEAAREEGAEPSR